MSEAVKKAKVNQTIIDLVQGDISKQDVDAIVNAANSSLLGGGGVDGAIHRAAGPKLLLECMTLGGCKTGQAKITKGYRLAAKHIIHTLGPVYRNESDPAQLLADCHYNSLLLAQEHHLKTIAFPAISTGVYSYPLAEASKVALQSVVNMIKEHQPKFELVRFVLFDTKALNAFTTTLRQLIEIDDAVTGV
ncbi:MAG: O-acetyl-ADP-ribose deacetylase [Chloroflexota bacterium]